MQRGDAGEDRRRAVLWIVMQERSAAGQLVLEVRELAAARAGLVIVLAADRQPEAVALRYHDRGRPDLDVELDHLAFLERLLLVMAVIGPPRPRELFVALAMRGAQPALCHRRVRIDRALEHDLFHLGRE